jgi:lipopolysaccharide biosynthesis glycosyltransferase
MKIAVSTTCSDGYVIFLEHFIKSILEHNPKFEYDYYVFCDARLSQKNRENLLSIYKNFKFQSVDYSIYQDKQKAHMKYYSIEMFNIPGYDRIIYWGADMICKNSLHDLFQVAKDIDGVAMPKEKRRNTSPCPFNNGSMIIGKKYIANGTYQKLLNFNNMVSPYNLTDQKLYNRFFDKKIEEIDQKYNVMVSELEFIKWDDILILHYFHKPTTNIGRKALNEFDKRLVLLWREYD